MRWTSPVSLLFFGTAFLTFVVWLFRSPGNEQWRELVNKAWLSQQYISSDEHPYLDPCPGPYRTDLSLQPTGLKAECVDLPLSKAFSGLFSASICTPIKVHTCNTFNVIIKRNKCNQRHLADVQVSSSQAEEYYVRSQLGSDTFHVAITGTELYATVTPKSYSQCEYVYEIPLSNSGSWKIQLWHIYEDYEGLAEIYQEPGIHYKFNLGKAYSGKLVHGRIPRWPRNLDRPLLPGGFDGLASHEINLPPSITCPARCPRYTFLDSLSNTKTRNSDRSPRRLHPLPIEPLPLCFDTEIIPGTFLPDPTPLHQVEEAPWTYYKWQPLGCRLREDVDLLLSDPREMTSYEKGRRETCLAQNKTFLMQGDSHLRMAWDALLPRLSGSLEPPVYMKAKRKEAFVDKLKYIFLWDPFLEKIGQEKADVILTTVGAHQASEHFLSTEVLEVLEAIAKQFAEWQAKTNGRLLYLNSPSRPPRGLPNGFSQRFLYSIMPFLDCFLTTKYRDWRTNPRMQYWNEEALKVFNRTELKVSLLSGYRSSLPFYKYTMDSAHFHETPVMEAWLQQIVHAANICELE